MKNILIVEAHSTGTNFIDDAIEMDYNPVVLYPKNLDTMDPNYALTNKKVKENYKDRAKFYEEIEDYQDILKLVREIDPVAIMTGAERGVELALRLSNDLNLPSNRYENLPVFTLKDEMQNACKDYGIRYIKSKNVKTLEEALDYYHSEKLEGCVLKPARGGGSVGVHLCDNEEDLIEAFEKELTGLNVFGENPDLILQERIYGTEYIVNTITYEGVHKLVSIFNYKKRRIEGGENVHDYGILIKDFNDEMKNLVDYSFKVADAIGYKYGAIHGEYIIDEKGPVLVEVNCRVRGANLPVDFLNATEGHHETDVILDMYLDPENYLAKASGPVSYEIKKAGGIKFVSVSRDMKTASFPLISISKHLKTYFSNSFGDADKIKFNKTNNLVACPGKIYLVDEDESKMRKDLMFLSKLNNQYEKLCLEDEKDYRGGKTVREKIDEFYSLADATPTGKEFVVPEEILENFPYEEEGIELLCESIDLKMKSSDGKIVCSK